MTGSDQSASSLSTSQPQRYLILTADYPPIEGGISTVTIQLADGLHRQGRLAAVGAPRLRGQAFDDSRFDYPVFRIPGYEWGPFRALRAKPTVQSWIRQHSNDFEKIIAMNGGFGGWLAVQFHRRRQLPFDTFAYGFDFLKLRRRPIARRILLNVYRKADRVLAISRFTAEQLEDFGVPAAKIHQVQLGVDTKRFHPPADKEEVRRSLGCENRRILLSVGRLIPRKGHALVIHALSRLMEKHPDLVYWIVGRGPEQQTLAQLAQQLGVKENVRFLGYRSDSELPSLYGASALLVLPASQVGDSVEGYGLVFLEAAACGIPSVAVRSGGVSEAVIDGETGILLQTAEIQPLTEALDELLSCPDRLQKLGTAARNRAEQLACDSLVDSF